MPLHRLRVHSHSLRRRPGGAHALWLAVVVATLAVSCAGSPARGTPSPAPIALGAAVTLAPGQSVTPAGTGWRLRFVDAVNDSRCPVGVQCIRAGDVTLRFVATNASGTTSDLAVRFGEGDATVAIGGRTLEVLDVQPAPIAGRPIAPGDYRATVTVR